MKTTLRKVMDRQRRREHKALSVFDRHQLKIARDTMKLSCAGCRILGGMNHADAVSILADLGNVIVALECDCQRSQ